MHGMQQCFSSHLTAVNFASLASSRAYLLDICRYSAPQGLISTALKHMASIVVSTFSTQLAQLHRIGLAYKLVPPARGCPKGNPQTNPLSTCTLMTGQHVFHGCVACDVAVVMGVVQCLDCTS